MRLHGSVWCLRSAGDPHRRGKKRDQTFLCIISSKIAVNLYVCNHAQFFKLNVYFFCRIDADGHQNRWRPSSTPTNTFHEDRTPFPFLSLTALFLFCAPQSCTQIAHASRPRRRSQRSSRRRAPPIMIRPTTPHSLTQTSSRGREEGWKKK